MNRFWMIIWILATPVLALAQPDEDPNITDQIIILERDYNPVLDNAVKREFQPELPAPTEDGQELTYSVPSQYLKIPYVAPEVRPLAMQHIELDALENVYAKLGFGNRALPMLDVYINSGRKSMYANRANNFNIGGHVGYLNSGAGHLKHQKYTDMDVEAFATYFTEKVAIGGRAGYYRDVAHYYGYNNEDTAFTSDMVRQRFNFFNVGMDIKNAQQTYYNISYNGKLDVNYLSDILGRNEFNPELDFALKKNFKNDNYLKGGLEVNFTDLSYDTVSQNSFHLGFNPAYRINQENWFAHLGLTIGTDDDGFFILPDVLFERELVGRSVVFQSGAQGHIETNNVKTLSDENPFLQKHVNIHNSRNINVFAGIKGAPVENLGYDLKVKYSNVSYLPLFVNDTTTITKFDVAYDTSAFILNLHGEVSYSLAEKLRLMAAVDYYNYDLENEAHPWHLPSLKATVGASYAFIENFTAGISVFGMNSRPGLEAKDGLLVKKDLPGIVDVNLNATYKISDNFHVFAEFNNITGAKYERWANYPTYGFNALGGLVLIF